MLACVRECVRAGVHVCVHMCLRACGRARACLCLSGQARVRCSKGPARRKTPTALLSPRSLPISLSRQPNQSHPLEERHHASRGPSLAPLRPVSRSKIAVSKTRAVYEVSTVYSAAACLLPHRMCVCARVCQRASERPAGRAVGSAAASGHSSGSALFRPAHQGAHAYTHRPAAARLYQEQP